MEPTTRPEAPRSPEAAAFADVMRSVLHTRNPAVYPGPRVAGPDALETWTDVDGYGWHWSTSRGQWSVTAGAMLDPRARVRGPAGDWTVERYDHLAAVELVAVLRLAGALPPPEMGYGRPDEQHPGPYPVRVAPDPPLPPPAWARYWRPGTDPFPHLCVDPPRPGNRYAAVALVAGAPPGSQTMLLPDGSQITRAADQPAVLPLMSSTGNGPYMMIRLEPVPDELLADQPDQQTAAAVIHAHRAAAGSEQTTARDPDADLALGPDDPAIAAAVAAEAAAGVRVATAAGDIGGPDVALYYYQDGSGAVVGTAAAPPGALAPPPTTLDEFAARRAAGETFPGVERSDEIGAQLDAIAAGGPDQHPPTGVGAFAVVFPDGQTIPVPPGPGIHTIPLDPPATMPGADLTPGSRLDARHWGSDPDLEALRESVPRPAEPGPPPVGGDLTGGTTGGYGPE